MAQNNNKNDYWVRNYNDGKQTHYVNGVGYDVYANDSLGRWESANTAYTNQNGGIAATGTVNNPTGFSQYTKMVEDGYRNSKAAAQGQIDAAVGTLRSGIDTTNNTYNNANRAAYLNMMNTQKGLNQQLAAAGLGRTGASESTRLANSVNYANNVNSNEAARLQAINDIYNQIAETQASGAMTLAQIDKELAASKGQAYLSQLASDREQMNTDRSYQQNERQYQDQALMDMLDWYFSYNVSPATIISAAKQAGYHLTEADLAYYKAMRDQAIRQAK